MQDYVCINNPLHINQMKMMIKRFNLAEILAQLLVALFLSVLIALQSVSAQTTCSSTDIDQDNDGLIDICDLEGLNDIRDNPSGSGTVEQGCSSTCTGFELTRDLDFNNNASYRDATTNKTTWTKGEGWEPIINFSATFNGNGYTISHLMINRSSDQIGLFRNTQNSSTITAVGLLNMNITGRSIVGGLVGSNFGTITKSYTTSVVFRPSSTGGGLVGNNSRSGNIINSCATGDVNSKGHNIGGLVGFNSGNIINSCATGDVNGGRSDVGGLAGENRGSITTSYATGNVNGQGNINNIGGLVGYNNKGTITNSYATGSVSGSGDNIRVGGLVGATFEASTIKNSYATGSVSGSGNNIVTGGLVGVLSTDGTITKSYWLDSSASSGGTNVNDTETERTVEQLTSPTTPATVSTDAYHDWSPSVWDFGTSDQFPVIKASGSDILTNLPLCTLSIPNEDGDDVKHAMDIDKDNDGLIEICDVEGLDAIRNNLTGSGSTEQGCRSGGCIGFELARSLDFTDNGSYRPATNEATYTVTTSTDVGWQPIGSSFSNFFRATFNGNDYTISNLMINESNQNVAGLFGYVQSSEITNLGLLDVEISGLNRVGSLVGRNRGTIARCYATGTVSGFSSVGGLVGLNSFNSRLGITGSITTSHAIVSVSGTSDDIGGLVAFNNGIITDSYATGNVTGTRFNVGGLVGWNGRNITYSYSTGNVDGGDDVGGLVGENQNNITYSYATGDVDGNNNNIGGLVGYNANRITSSYAIGDVDGNNDNIGGLVGENDGTITNSYATAKVNGDDWVGGLVGKSDGTITNSYATGATTAARPRTGGLVGELLTSGMIEYSYWLSGSASTGGGNVSTDAKKTAEELKSPTRAEGIYSNWNSDDDNDDWDFGTSDQFPVLKYPDGNLIPGQGTTLTGSSLRESLRELEIPEVRTTSSQIFGVSTNNYVVTIFLPTGTTERRIVLRLKAYNPDAEIQIFREGDPTDYFAGKMSGDESLPIVVGEDTKLTIRVNKPDTDYTLTFRVEELEGIQIRVKVFLEGPLQ